MKNGKIFKCSLLALCALGFSGCALMDKKDADEEHFVSTYDSTLKQHTRMASVQGALYKPAPVVTVYQYAQSLMHDLVAGLEIIAGTNFTMGVASFVYLDSELQHTDVFGNQLAESLMHEATQFGIAVTDFKMTDSIRITPEGDYVFSRDFLELTQHYPLSVILSGTLARHQGGLLVNARIINVMDKKVLGSAQTFIPDAVVSAVKSQPKAPLLPLKGKGNS